MTLHAGPAGQHAAQTLLPLCLDQLVDERGGGGEAHTSALTADRDRQAGGQVTLAGAGIADQQDRLGAFEIIPFDQSSDTDSRDVGRLRESNSSSVLIRGRWASCRRNSIERRSRSSTAACSRASN